MKKLNNKGYMLVEIIMAFAITFGLLYFMMDLVIKMKNNNDDLLVETIVKTDSTIITNKLMSYAMSDVENDDDAKKFCENLKIEGHTIKYNGNIIEIVDDTSTIGSFSCKGRDGKVSVRIPLDVKQMSDREYDVIIDYRYDNVYNCNPIQSYQCKNTSKGSDPAFVYSEDCEVVDEGSGNWKIKFLKSGELKTNCDMEIDAFLVGGGGAGGSWTGGGGGGGLTTTTFTVLKTGITYPVVIGEGGIGDAKLGSAVNFTTRNGKPTYAFGSMAAGGTTGDRHMAGTGGSGGGVNNDGKLSDGGIDGSNGQSDFGVGTGGTGQGTTTREFGESSNDILYAGGGGAGSSESSHGDNYGLGGDGGGGNGGSYYEGGDGAANTGGGGGGGGKEQFAVGGNGGSGIVVIRNTRIADTSNLPGVKFAFTYSGYYAVISEGSGNWKIKFLTSGTFNSKSALSTNVFLVGGGGAGGSNANVGNDHGGGGGGSGYTKTGNASIVANTNYTVTVGAGGTGATSINGGTGGNGQSSFAFNLSANGGLGGKTSWIPGSGGSGGGSPTDSTTKSGNGGSNGSSGSGNGGSGQGTTTREFGSSSATLYAGGGGGGWKIGSIGGAGGGGMGGGYFNGADGLPNSGGGGGGGGEIGNTMGGNGGSGIVIIRNAR